MTGSSERLPDSRTHRNMFEAFKHRMVQELGPLHANWFEELTARAGAHGGSAQDSETHRGTCVPETSVSTPVRKSAVDSQIFSTPKIFKAPAVQSPELLTTDEELLSPAQGAAGGSKVLPWVDTSMCFFGSAKKGQAPDKRNNTSLTTSDFALLSMQKSLASTSTKRISESLGAQLDPDVSWTSSLNTPPVMSPTVLLTKEEDKSCVMSPSGDKRVILVRELFPSASKVSRMTEISEKPDHRPAKASCQVGCSIKESDRQKLTSVNEDDGAWKQTLPDAIRDGDVRSTVASVLDGAEDVLSIFFSSSGAGLRRARAPERSRRRQTSSAKAAGLSPPPPLANGSLAGPAKMASRAEDAKSISAFRNGNSAETKDCGDTQWTPLTLPDVLDTSAGADYLAVPPSFDGCAALAAEEQAEGPADAAELKRLTSAGDKSQSLDKTVPGSALAECDTVLTHNESYTEGKTTCPLRSTPSQQRAEAWKRIRFGDSQTTVLSPKTPLLQSKHGLLSPGNCPMQARSPGYNLCSTPMQSSGLTFQQAGSLSHGSSLGIPPSQSHPALTWKPPRKFVYSVKSSQPHGNTEDSHRNSVSIPTPPFPGGTFNGKSIGNTGMSCVKTLHRGDNVIEHKFERKTLSEPPANINVCVVSAATNEAGSQLDYTSVPRSNSAAYDRQDGNPGRDPSCSTDTLGCEIDAISSSTACLVMGTKLPGRPSPSVLPEKPGSNVDCTNYGNVNFSSYSSAVSTGTILPPEMNTILHAPDTTLITNETQRGDSGYHTTWSDATQLHGAPDTVSSSRKVTENLASFGFKTASNRIISLPPEAIQRAKALLDECVEDVRIESPISKGKGPQKSSEWNHRSNYNDTKASKVANAAANAANVMKAQQPFKGSGDKTLLEISHRTSHADIKGTGPLEAETGMSKSLAAPSLTVPSFEQKGSEAYGGLTASQKADVTELCSLLEESNSQFEFTQFKRPKSASADAVEDAYPHPCDKEVDPDFLSGIDFDDSFSTDCERQGHGKQLADTNIPEKLTADSFHLQTKKESCLKANPVEFLSRDFSDKNAECLQTLHSKHSSASLGPGKDFQSGGFASFSSASGKKITLSKEGLSRASKIFDDLDESCIPSQNSEHERSRGPTHSNLQDTTSTKVRDVRNIPDPHMVFCLPRSNVVELNHCAKKTGRSFCGGSQSIQEDGSISKPNLPTGNLEHSLIDSSFQLQPVASNLEGAGSNFKQLISLPCLPKGVGTESLDEHLSLPSIISAEKEQVCLDNAVSKQPSVSHRKGPLQSDTDTNLGTSNSRPDSSRDMPSVGLNAKGDPVNVSKTFLRKAGEIFTNLEDNQESAPRLDPLPQPERQKVVVEDKKLPECADASNKPKATAEKRQNKNGTMWRSFPPDYGSVRPHALDVDKEFDVTSVNSGVENSIMDNNGTSACLDKRCQESPSKECGHISASCRMPVVSDGVNGNDSTPNALGNCGFSTAGGKKVTVSTESLHSAQSLLNECGQINAPAPGKSSRVSNGYVSSCNPVGGNNGGFRTASGKGVFISPKAVEQAKALLQNCDDGAEYEITGAAVGDGIGQETSGCLMNPTLASSDHLSGGEDISVSAKVAVGMNDTLENPAPTHGSGEVNTNKKNFKLCSNFGKVNCGFSTAGGKKVYVSEKALLRANALLKECEEKQHLEPEKLEFMAGSAGDPQQKNRCGFSTASGKGVAVSLKALQEAKARFAGCNNADLPEACDVKTDTLRVDSTSALKKELVKSNDGFSTASGKMVSVSADAILKAKAFLSDCCDVSSVEPGRPIRMDCTASSVPDRQSESTFMTSRGGGKERSTAVKDGNETEVARKDCSSNNIAEVVQVNGLIAKGGSRNNTRNCPPGFSTARGVPVAVSLTALEEAKNKFRDCDNVDHIFGVKMKEEPLRNKMISTHSDKTASGICNITKKTVVYQTKNFAPVKSDRSERSVVVRNSKHHPQTLLSQGEAAARQNAEDETKTSMRPNASTASQGLLGKTAVGMMDCEKMQSNGSGDARQSSSLNLRALGLGNCTDTQQRYLEQEAMACTRALLEDEDLAEPGLQEASGNRDPCQDSETRRSTIKGAEENHGRGKRLRSEDFDYTGQPSLKRRLLAEFEQSSDRDEQSKLTPVKSSPNVTLRDRRSGLPFQPNVTRPPGDERGVFDQRQRITEPQVVVPGSFLQDGKPANPRGAVFVPPFSKCLKPKIQGTSLPPDSRRPPRAFLPPFRKSLPNGMPLAPGPQQPSSTRSGAPPQPAVFVPPLKNTSVSAAHPGSEEQISGEDAGIPQAAPYSACGGPSSGQDPASSSAPSQREAGPERSTLEPPSPHELEPSSSDQQMLQSLQLARDLQDMRIRKKRRQVIRPQPSSLLLAKTSGVSRVSLRTAVGGRCPRLHTAKELYACGVPAGVSQISSDRSESFRFCCQDFFRVEALWAGGGVQLADGGRLVPSDDGSAGKEEFYRALCDTAGVDPKLISEDWVYNHYRWVVWKRASMERAFPAEMGGRCLTPEQVLLQLKYRYDVEVDQSRRSALRKIMERDDTPTKTMVLCVCGVVSRGSAPPGSVLSDSRTSPGPGAKAGGSAAGVVWVTDGWYAIKALLDAPMTTMLLNGRLAVGGKVVTHGAELVGSQDACSPLEAPESLMLKISANSTRPARWDAKLGFHRDPRPFRLPLSSLHGNGGLVGCVDIVVLRSYPTQWMEKRPGGVFVFRNDRAEEREARRHGDGKHKAMELLFARIQTQFEKEQETETQVKSRRQRLTRQEIEALQDGEELHEAVESDPVYLQSCLNTQQLARLSSYRQALGQERQARLQERFRQALVEAQQGEGGCFDREVTPVWKLAVCDFREQLSGGVYLLSIWRPAAEVRSLLKEGCRYRVYQLATSLGKKQAGKAAVQLTATKRTQFQHVQAATESLQEVFQPRMCVGFRALQSAGLRLLCGEVDIVGFIISCTDRHGPSPVLYLADQFGDLVCVRLYASLAQLALEELVKPRALLALSNLQLRHQAPAPVPSLYAGELSLFSTNPKEPHLREACALLRGAAQGNEHFFQMAEERLSNFIPSNAQCSLLSPREVAPSPKMVNGHVPQQLVRTPGLFTPVSKRPPAPAGNSEDRDPRSVKRRRGLDFLSRIPSPPPLGPLCSVVSPSVKKTFNPPRRSETPRAAAAPPRIPPPPQTPPPHEAEWVKDEELAMINTQALLEGLGEQELPGVAR